MSRWKLYILVVLAVGAAVVWSVVFHLLSQADTLLFVAFDVGQGDALFIQTESGAQILIDGGPGDAVLSRLGGVMPFWDRSLDAIILTHPDADHINGLVEVLKRYRVGFVLESGVESASGAYAEWRRIIEEKNIPVVYAAGGQKLVLDEGTRLSILSPMRSQEGAIVAKANNASIVLRLDYENVSFLLTGDIEKSVEQLLGVLMPQALDTDILKVGHHGSKTSSSAEFLTAVTPDAAIISAGARNTYGHPHKEVLTRLEELAIPIFRTDTGGDVRFRSDGERVWVVR